MTRREEIKLQAEEYRQPYRDGGYNISSRDVRDTFEEGAEWADKTMIEKACKWLESKLKSYLGYYEAADFADTFRKAMLKEE